jgi:uncharacterized protein (TIGR00369 family)
LIQRVIVLEVIANNQKDLPMSAPHYAKDVYGLLPMEQMLDYSGLDFMKGILNGDLPAPPIAQTLNFRLKEVVDGKVVFTGAPQFASLNPMGTVHGGWYGTVLDSAMSCAVMTKVPRGSFYTTLEFKVNIVRSIPVDRVVDVIGTVDHAGRSTGISHGQIIDVETGQLYATGSTTCIIMKA